MNRNPLIPFALIAVIGIILTVGISFYGLNNADQLLAEDEGENGGETSGEEIAVVNDPEGLYQASCASCHGQNLEGVVGPALNKIGGKLSAEEIASVITNGQGAMPPGLVDAAKAEQIAAWLAEKK